MLKTQLYVLMGFAHSGPIFCYSYCAMNISNISSILSNGVKDKIFPGAVLSISINGTSPYQMAVGNFTYDQNSPSCVIINNF